MLTVEINSLRPNAFNTNRVSPENEEKLLNSLKKFGVYKPIICREAPDQMLEIIGGEHRWRAAKKIGLKEVPIVNLGIVSEEKARQLMLTDNGRYGEDDTFALAELLRELGTEDIQSFLPYSDDELDSIFASSSIDLDDLDSPTDDIDLDSLPSKKAQSHVMMRFKVPVEDSELIQKIIDTTMKSQGFTADDSMTNAGHALVHLLRASK